MCGGLASIAVLGSFVDAAPQRNEDVIPHWYTVVPVLGVRACNSRMSKQKFWIASRSSRFQTILVRFPWLPDVLFSGPQTMPRHYSFGASHSSESWQALQLCDSMLFWCMLPRWGYQMLEIYGNMWLCFCSKKLGTKPFANQLVRSGGTLRADKVTYDTRPSERPGRKAVERYKIHDESMDLDRCRCEPLALNCGMDPWLEHCELRISTSFDSSHGILSGICKVGDANRHHPCSLENAVNWSKFWGWWIRPVTE